MLQQTLETNFRRFKNFLGFSRGFIRRNNPLKKFYKDLVQSVKDVLLVNKKLKLAQNRVKYQMYQLHKMEKLIAENNDHTFLKGKNINEVR